MELENEAHFLTDIMISYQNTIEKHYYSMRDINSARYFNFQQKCIDKIRYNKHTMVKSQKQLYIIYPNNNINLLTV